MNRAVLDQILQRARQAHPIECCGIFAAKTGGKEAIKCIPIRNRAASEVYFSFDSLEQFRALRELDACEEECIGIYHSHTGSDAAPSREDIEMANDPDMHYLIVSTWRECPVPVRSFRIIGGGVFEESIQFVGDPARLA